MFNVHDRTKLYNLFPFYINYKATQEALVAEKLQKTQRAVQELIYLLKNNLKFERMLRILSQDKKKSKQKRNEIR